jgi:hypothetical protein
LDLRQFHRIKTNQMINGLIITFDPHYLLLRVQDGKETIAGSWFSNLAESLGGNVEFIGQDERKRIEVYISFELFEKLKNERSFLSSAHSMRRIRTTPRDVLGKLVYSQYGEFDNDLG